MVVVDRPLEANDEDARRVGTNVVDAAGPGERLLERDADRVERDHGVEAGRASGGEGLRIARDTDHVAGLHIDVLGRVVEDRLHRNSDRGAVADQSHEDLVCRRTGTASGGDDVEKPVAARGQRHPRTAGHLADHRDGVGDVLRYGHQRLRLDCLLAERLHDGLLDFGGRSTGDAHAAGIGHRQGAIGADDLLGNHGRA